MKAGEVLQSAVFKTAYKQTAGKTAKKVMGVKNYEPVLVSLFKNEDERNSYMEKFNELKNKLNAAKSGAPDPAEVTLAAKRQILEGLIKTVQMLQGEMYTKDSWKACMSSYKNALIASAKQDAGSKALDKAINLLRAGLSRLEVVEPEDEAGSSLDKKRVEDEAAQQGLTEQAKAEAEQIISEASAAAVSAEPATAE